VARALPLHPRPTLDTPYVAPSTPQEQRIAEIWQAALGVEPIGVNDNFYALRGDSLLGIQMLVRVCSAFKTELSLRAMLDAPTIAGLAKLVAAGPSMAIAPPIAPRADRESLPLSFGQQRGFRFDELDPGCSFEHIGLVTRLCGTIAAAALAHSLEAIVARHEVLRARYARRDGKLTQWIDPTSSVPFERFETRGTEADRRAEAQSQIAAALDRPFDLARGPLLRAGLIQLDEEDHVLFVLFHHITFDSFSMGVLWDEIVAHYGSFVRGELPSLPALPFQYADFAAWQGSLAAGSFGKAALKFWRGRLEGAIPLLLPADHPRAAVDARWRSKPLSAFPAAEHEWTASQSLLKPLDEIARGRGVTLRMLVMAAFAALLHRSSGQRDISFSTAHGNREREGTERLIGCFNHPLYTRLLLDGDARFAELLPRLRDEVLLTLDHSDFSLWEFIEAPAELFRVSFNYRIASGAPASLPGLPGKPPVLIAPWPSPPILTTRFDLSFYLMFDGTRLQGTALYNAALFDHAGVGRLLARFTAILEAVAANPNLKLSELP
jgi:hypothetical protein